MASLHDEVWETLQVMHNETNALIIELRKLRKITKPVVDKTGKEVDYLRKLSLQLANKIHTLQANQCDGNCKKIKVK